MNSAALSPEAYALIRGLRHIGRIKAKFVSERVRSELESHRLVRLDRIWLQITDRGMSVPAAPRAA